MSALSWFNTSAPVVGNTTTSKDYTKQASSVAPVLPTKQAVVGTKAAPPILKSTDEQSGYLDKLIGAGSTVYKEREQKEAADLRAFSALTTHNHELAQFMGDTKWGTPEWDQKYAASKEYVKRKEQSEIAAFNASPEGRLKAAYKTWENQLNNFKGTAADKQKLINEHVRDQLLAQSKGYGFSWKANKDEIFHATNVANMLTSQGVNDLSLLKYDKKGDLYKTSFSDSPDGGRFPAGYNDVGGKTSKINWYKNDDENRGQVGWSSAGTGRTNYMVKADAAGNPVFYPDWKSNAPSGIGGFLIQAAPAIAGIVGGPGAAAATAAAIGAASGQSPGDILKGAALSGGTAYLGGAANVATQGALAGLNPDLVAALGGAAQGATQSGAAGIITGNFDLDAILKSASAGGAASGLKSLLTEQLPAGQQGPVQPKNITGISSIDKLLPGAAANTVGQVVAGRDLGTALTNTAIGAAGNLAAGQVGGALSGLTGIPEIDRLLAGTGAGLTGAGLTTYLRDQLASPVTPTRPAPATAATKPTTTTASVKPTTTTAAVQPTTSVAAPAKAATTAAIPTTAALTTTAPTATPTTTTAPATTTVNGNNNLLNYLSLAGLVNGGQSGGTTSAPVLANVQPMDLGWLSPTVNRLYPKKVA